MVWVNVYIRVWIVFNEFVSMCVIACILVRMNFIMFLFLCSFKCMCINPLRVLNFCSVSLLMFVYVSSCMQAYLCVCACDFMRAFLWTIFNEFMCLLVYMCGRENMWMHSCFCFSVCLRLCELKYVCAQVHHSHCVRPSVLRRAFMHMCLYVWAHV